MTPKEKLASSGLTLRDARRCHIALLDADAVSKLGWTQGPALCFNYLDHLRRPILGNPRGQPFYRLRFLQTPAGFGGKTSDKRYVQPPGTVPAAYYPQNWPDWPGYAADPAQPLVITEGELKAAAACKAGFACLGLGGVDSWRALRRGYPWLPSFSPISWVGRVVYLCFDSDLRHNQHVCRALQALADQLTRRGARPQLVLLPSLPDLDKVGLDDYLLHAGPKQFQTLLDQAQPLGLSGPLFQLNRRYCYVQDPGLVVDLADPLRKLSPSGMVQHHEATEEYYQHRLLPNGKVSYQPTTAAAAWLKWPLRAEAQGLTYRPGRAKLTQGLLNTWPGWGCQPAAGDVGPFLQLLAHLFTGAEAADLEWFLCWSAYPLQYPGTKLYSSVVVHGRYHGTGKSLVGYTLGQLYGRNFAEISQVDLHSSFNEWSESKQFILGDDVTGSDKRADADYLKKLITQQQLRINKKFLPTYVVPDCVNYYFTSQSPNAFFLEDEDRRFFVHEVQAAPLSEESYVDYGLWLESGGPSAVFHYLLQLDLGDFNPAAPARRTLAKQRMTQAGRSDLADWVRQLLDDPDRLLVVGQTRLSADLFTSGQLLQLYDPDGRTRTTAVGLGRELSRAGVPQVCGGQPLRTDQGQHRYFAIRQPDRWKQAQPDAVRDHVNNSLQRSQGML